MGLQRVWIETLDAGLVRADQVVEVRAHQTAAFSGKPARWLVDVVLPVGQGAGTAGQWNLGACHRTLVQTADEPEGAAARLVRLLWQLDESDAAGIVSLRRTPDGLHLGVRPFGSSAPPITEPSPVSAQT